MARRLDTVATALEDLVLAQGHAVERVAVANRSAAVALLARRQGEQGQALVDLAQAARELRTRARTGEPVAVPALARPLWSLP